MELKDVKFEPIGDAAKSYPQSTLVIRKQLEGDESDIEVIKEYK